MSEEINSNRRYSSTTTVKPIELPIEGKLPSLSGATTMKRSIVPSVVVAVPIADGRINAKPVDGLQRAITAHDSSTIGSGRIGV